MCQKRKSNSSSSFICLTNIKSENSNYKMQPNAVSFEGHEWAAVIIITISLSINHNGYVIGIDGPLLKMMTLNPRQLINTEKNWLSGNSWSWFVVAWKPVLPQNVKDRWFPCWNLTSPLVHLLPPVTPRHAHRSALTNQRRGGLQRFFAPSDTSDGLLLDFGTPLIIREEVCDSAAAADGDQDGATEEPAASLLLWRLFGEEVLQR